MTSRAFLGMSHSPLLGLNPLAPEVEQDLQGAIAAARERPPVPTLGHPDPAIRERITVRREATAAERDAKTQKVMAAGRAPAAADRSMKPLNPEWDLRCMDALEQGDLDALTSLSEASITADAGLSAHESKTWLIARAALPEGVPLETTLRCYRAIPDLIAGYGVLFMQTRTL